MVKVVPAAFAAIAGMLLVSKLRKRGKGKRASKTAVVKPEPNVTQLPNIIEEEQDPSSSIVEATPNNKRPISGYENSVEKDHKIKAMKVQDASPPATPMVLKPTAEEAEQPQADDEVESIPSPPSLPIAAPPALTSEFALADSTKESLFEEGESQADSQESSLSRGGSLKKLGSKVKGQFRKLSSRSSKSSSIQ